jgi:hypothetical protein
MIATQSYFKLYSNFLCPPQWLSSYSHIDNFLCKSRLKNLTYSKPKRLRYGCLLRWHSLTKITVKCPFELEHKFREHCSVQYWYLKSSFPEDAIERGIITLQNNGNASNRLNWDIRTLRQPAVVIHLTSWTLLCSIETTKDFQLLKLKISGTIKNV